MCSAWQAKDMSVLLPWSARDSSSSKVSCVCDSHLHAPSAGLPGRPYHRHVTRMSAAALSRLIVTHARQASSCPARRLRRRRIRHWLSLPAVRPITAPAHQQGANTQPKPNSAHMPVLPRQAGGSEGCAGGAGALPLRGCMLGSMTCTTPPSAECSIGRSHCACFTLQYSTPKRPSNQYESMGILVMPYNFLHACSAIQ